MYLLVALNSGVSVFLLYLNFHFKMEIKKYSHFLKLALIFQLHKFYHNFVHLKGRQIYLCCLYCEIGLS